MPTLLIIDDEANIRFSIRQVFAGEKVTISEAGTAEEGLRLAAELAPDVILLDIRLGAVSGLDLFAKLREIDKRSLVIFITGYGTTETAINAMRLGAYDYLVKPLDAVKLRQVVGQAFVVSRLMHVPAVIDDSARPEEQPDYLIGSGQAMQEVCKMIGRVASQDVSVLVTGENGTGKELVARAIYQHSGRNRSTFLSINCAAMPEKLLESELFGHEQGAFPGADRVRIGKLEQSRGGTLFLDEIADLPPGTQSKLLRMLQDGVFERLGGNQSIRADVRILAATKQDLATFIAKGSFRKDLFFRLRGVTIHLPALRERKEDLAELAHYFIFRFNRQLGTCVQSISVGAMELMERYAWPGNIRELQNVIREALIVARGPVLLPDSLPIDVQSTGCQEFGDDAETAGLSFSEIDWKDFSNAISAIIASGKKDIYHTALDLFDRMVISQVMRLNRGKQNHAAEMLGISRVTLRAKLRHFGLLSDS